MSLLLDLPHELLLAIWDALDPESDEGTRNALVQTCRYFRVNFEFRLYQGTVKVTAPSVHALEWAARNGQVGTIQKLLNAGLCHTNDASKAVLAAAKYGHRDAIQTLLWHDFDPNEKDICGLCTPLHRAATEGHVEIIKDLLEAGADTEALDHDSETAYAIAVLGGQANAVSFFLTRGISTETLIHGQGTSLAWAARCGHLQVMDALLDAGADIKAVTGNGETILFWAARCGQPTSLALLLARGAAPDVPDRRGETPLHAACACRGPVETITLLLQHVEVDRRALSNGRTAMAVAASVGFVETIKPLLESGADPTIKDADGSTPLALAARYGQAAYVLALLEVDADACEKYIDMPDECGRTPLFLATLYGHEQIVRVLLAKGSLARKKLTSAGRSPLSFAHDHQVGEFNLRAVWEWLACPYYADVDQFAVLKASAKARRAFGSARCDQCQFALSTYDTHFHCAICHNDDFDICMECLGGGFTCLNPSHVLQKCISVDGLNWVPVPHEFFHQNTQTVTNSSITTL